VVASRRSLGKFSYCTSIRMSPEVAPVEQFSPIYKWTLGELQKVQSCPRWRASRATNAKPRWATRGAPGIACYAARFNCGKAATYFCSGVSRSTLVGRARKQLPLPFGDLVGVQLKLLAQLRQDLVLPQCGQRYSRLERCVMRAPRRCLRLHHKKLSFAKPLPVGLYTRSFHLSRCSNFRSHSYHRGLSRTEHQLMAPA